MEWIILLLVVLVLVGMVFLLRQRRRVQREAEDERAQAFLMAIQGVAHTPPPSAGAAAASIPRSTGAKTTDVPPSSLGMADTHRPRPTAGSGRGYLEHSHQVVFRWLRAGLPECEIFARGSLRRVVGGDRVQKDLMLDFVVCNDRFEVLAVVDLDRRGQSDPSAAFKRMLLEEAGVVYACWSAAQLPDQASLRQWLDGVNATTTLGQMAR